MLRVQKHLLTVVILGFLPTSPYFFTLWTCIYVLYKFEMSLPQELLGFVLQLTQKYSALRWSSPSWRKKHIRSLTSLLKAKSLQLAQLRNFLVSFFKLPPGYFDVCSCTLCAKFSSFLIKLLSLHSILWLVHIVQNHSKQNVWP